MAELGAITGLAQPRISTHLGKLRQAGMVQSRRSGTNTWYRLINHRLDGAQRQLWNLMTETLEDNLLKQDAMRLPAVLRQRLKSQRWVDSVAGDMERHYSPGRTWESTARVLAELGGADRILDIASGDGVLADLLKQRVSDYLCVDINPRVVAAGRQRLSDQPQVHFARGDMHKLPVRDGSYPLAVVLHALSFTRQPQVVINETARCLDSKGRLILVTLAQHQEAAAVEAFDHLNNGFSATELQQLAKQAGLTTVRCEVICTERRPPYFQVLMLHARKD